MEAGPETGRMKDKAKPRREDQDDKKNSGRDLIRGPRGFPRTGDPNHKRNLKTSGSRFNSSSESGKAPAKASRVSPGEHRNSPLSWEVIFSRSRTRPYSSPRKKTRKESGTRTGDFSAMTNCERLLSSGSSMSKASSTSMSAPDRPGTARPSSSSARPSRTFRRGSKPG